MGSLEAAQAILKGDQQIHVWSPASALYKDVFVQEWDHSALDEPIAREEAAGPDADGLRILAGAYEPSSPSTGRSRSAR